MPAKNPTQPVLHSRTPQNPEFIKNPFPNNGEESRIQARSSETPTIVPAKTEAEESNGNSARERLKRHRVEVAGRVWIPEMWGQENLLKDWVDCTAFDATVMSSTADMARASLAEQGRRVNSATVKNAC